MSNKYLSFSVDENILGAHIANITGVDPNNDDLTYRKDLYKNIFIYILHKIYNEPSNLPKDLKNYDFTKITVN